MQIVKKVDYAFIKQHFSPFPNTIFVEKKYKDWYVLFNNDIPVAMLAIYNNAIKALYVPTEFRRKGYASSLIKYAVDTNAHLETLANKSSIKAFMNNGFIIIREYNKTNSKGVDYTLWRMKH